MLAENALRRLIAPRTLSRGDAYYAQGRVRRIEKVGDGAIEAQVQGSELYYVTLSIEGNELHVECTCPWFLDNEQECKHIWAVIRSASARRMLPERDLYLAATFDGPYDPDDDIDEESYDYEPQELTSPRGLSPHAQRPPWQSFLDAIGPAPPVNLSPARSVPETIVYAIEPLPSSQRLTFQIIGRSHKKNGEWGKWKQLSIRLDDLHLLDPFDRESLALLNQHTWAHTVERMVNIPSTTAAWWIERLARAGKLGILDKTQPRKTRG